MIDDLVDALQDGARWVVDGVETLIEAPTAIDWILIVLGLGLLWHVWARVRSTGVLGPLKVADLEADGDIPKVGLSALLRDELGSRGFVSSPAMPAGSPDETVISAVEGSPVPQAAWIGKLLRVFRLFLPRVRQYEVTGALMEREAPPDQTKGLAYGFSDSGSSATYIPLAWKASHEQAVSWAATDIYMRITQSDESVFPAWTVWRNRDALESYLGGLTSEEIGTETELVAAALGFAAASEGEPWNWLPVVRLANVLETRAALAEDDQARLQWEVEAMLLYGEVVLHVETLVQARYRLSVLLAGQDPAEYTGAYPTEHLSVLTGQGPGSPPDQIWTALKRLALEQSAETRRRLRPMSVFLNESRIRNRYEPRGRERRRFRKAVRISYYCIRRRIGDTRWRDRPGVFLAFVGRQGIAGWQAHYNAACYYALAEDPDPAFTHLRRAVKDPASGITPVWLQGDPDLVTLQTDFRWAEILALVDPSAAAA